MRVRCTHRNVVIFLCRVVISDINIRPSEPCGDGTGIDDGDGSGGKDVVVVFALTL